MVNALPTLDWFSLLLMMMVNRAQWHPNQIDAQHYAATQHAVVRDSDRAVAVLSTICVPYRGVRSHSFSSQNSSTEWHDDGGAA